MLCVAVCISGSMAQLGMPWAIDDVTLVARDVKASSATQGVVLFRQGAFNSSNYDSRFLWRGTSTEYLTLQGSKVGCTMPPPRTFTGPRVAVTVNRQFLFFLCTAQPPGFQNNASISRFGLFVTAANGGAVVVNISQAVSGVIPIDQYGNVWAFFSGRNPPDMMSSTIYPFGADAAGAPRGNSVSMPAFPPPANISCTAVDPNGFIFVADSAGTGVWRGNVSNPALPNSIAFFPAPGLEPNGRRRITAMAFQDTVRLWIADDGLDPLVQVYRYRLVSGANGTAWTIEYRLSLQADPRPVRGIVIIPDPYLGAYGLSNSTCCHWPAATAAYELPAAHSCPLSAAAHRCPSPCCPSLAVTLPYVQARSRCLP